MKRSRLGLAVLVLVCLVAVVLMVLVPIKILEAGLVYRGF